MHSSSFAPKKSRVVQGQRRVATRVRATRKRCCRGGGQGIVGRRWTRVARTRAQTVCHAARLAKRRLQVCRRACACCRVGRIRRQDDGYLAGTGHEWTIEILAPWRELELGEGQAVALHPATRVVAPAGGPNGTPGHQSEIHDHGDGVTRTPRAKRGPAKLRSVVM